jgi:hypothetical protein
MLCLFKYEITYSKLEVFENRLSGFLKNPVIFLRKCQKCVEELKFCMNELFNNVFKAFSFLKFREDHFGFFRKKIASLQCVESIPFF